MIFIILGGMPKSGKTTVASKIKDAIHIHRDLFDGDYIKKWNDSLNMLSATLQLHHNIVFDSCGTNFNSLHNYIVMAKMMGYKTYYIYIHRKSNDCDIDSSLLEEYKQKFASSLNKFKNVVHEFKIINNNHVNNAVHNINKMLGKYNGTMQIQK